MAAAVARAGGAWLLLAGPALGLMPGTGARAGADMLRLVGDGLAGSEQIGTANAQVGCRSKLSDCTAAQR